MTVLKSFVIAFSMYSKIPMPQFEWKEKDMRYIIAFFPLVGLVIGALTWIWWQICGRYQLNDVVRICIGILIPLAVTGGIHVDGFMDTMDALNSYQSKERKLEILKDSHIGAFCVIKLLEWGLLYGAAYGALNQEHGLVLLVGSFYLARILSGIAVVTFPCAKKDGILYLFSSKAQERIVKVVLMGQLLGCVAVLFWLTGWQSLVMEIPAGLCFFYYYWKMKKEFGGITGDTAGYFVVVSETVMVLIVAALSVWLK